MYLVMGGVSSTFGVEIRQLDNIERLENLLRSLSRKVNLNEIKPDRTIKI